MLRRGSSDLVTGLPPESCYGYTYPELGSAHYQTLPMLTWLRLMGSQLLPVASATPGWQLRGDALTAGASKVYVAVLLGQTGQALVRGFNQAPYRGRRTQPGSNMGLQHPGSCLQHLCGIQLQGPTLRSPEKEPPASFPAAHGCPRQAPRPPLLQVLVIGAGDGWGLLKESREHRGPSPLSSRRVQGGQFLGAGPLQQQRRSFSRPQVPPCLDSCHIWCRAPGQCCCSLSAREGAAQGRA